MSIRRKVALWFVSIFLVIAGLGTGAYGWFNVQAAYLATSSLSSDAAGEEARMARSDERLRKEIEVREKDYEKLRRRALLQQKYFYTAAVAFCAIGFGSMLVLTRARKRAQ